MAALVSPGISITVTDESQYLPTAVGTIPFVLFASAENKVINNTIAAGTKKSNAGKVVGISSQRELVATFGAPNFRTNSAGTPIHADELNDWIGATGQVGYINENGCVGLAYYGELTF